MSAAHDEISRLTALYGSPRGDDGLSGAKVPPHSVEAEQSVLGGLMLAPQSFEVVSDALVAEDFYRRDHQLIYQAICELADKQQPFDAVTLGEWFVGQGQSELIADGVYLIELASAIPSAANIAAYAGIVRDKSMKRQLIDAGSEITRSAYEPDGRESAELVDEAGKLIGQLEERQITGKQVVVSVKDALKASFAALRDRFQAGGGMAGISCGYGDLDRIIYGLQPTDLLILAARPAMGKTTLALNIAEHVAIESKSGKCVMAFSMEMSAKQWADRIISSQSRVLASHIQRAEIQDEDWGRMHRAIQLSSDAKLFIDDTPALTPRQLRARAKRIKRKHGLDLVIVDYLQLMTTGSKNQSREGEVSEISRSLKALAKELNVPVIALSQLNRSLETRTDKRPVMADLRESGAIEQDADVVMFIYRDDYYNPETSPDKGLAEIIIGKNRKGSTGSIKLKSRLEYNRFDKLSPTHDLDMAEEMASLSEKPAETKDFNAALKKGRQ